MMNGLSDFILLQYVSKRKVYTLLEIDDDDDKDYVTGQVTMMPVYKYIKDLHERSIPMLDHVRHGRIDKVKEMLSEGVNPYVTGNYGCVLHYAAIGGQKEMIYMFIAMDIDIKLDIDRVDRRGNTPLHYAAIYNHIEIVKLLLNYRAKINKSNFEDITPLQSIIDRDYIYDEVISLLILNGAR